MDSHGQIHKKSGIEGSVFALRQPRKAKDLPLATLAPWRLPFFRTMEDF
jgi:hypothetical protein